MNPEEYKKFAGLTEGRVVHVVLPSGEHRPGTVVERQALLNEATGERAPLDAGVIGVSVLLAPRDCQELYDLSDPFSPSPVVLFGLTAYVIASPFDDRGETPLSWHWPERA